MTPEGLYTHEEIVEVFNWIKENVQTFAEKHDSTVFREVSEKIGRSENSIENFLRRQLNRGLVGVDPEAASSVRAYFEAAHTSAPLPAIAQDGTADNRRTIRQKRIQNPRILANAEDEEAAERATRRLAARSTRRENRRLRNRSDTRSRSPRVTFIFHGAVTMNIVNFHNSARTCRSSD